MSSPFFPSLTRILVVTLMLPAATLAMAADADSYTEEDFLGELPVVLSATRLSQPAQDAPASITVIDRDMIRASGAREIAEIFRLVPGFVVSHDSGYRPVVTYHGLSNQYARRMQVLVDGRSVYSPVMGGTNWTNLPLAIDDIERIEVIRGPNAASYGANAFLATINIITTHSAQASGTLARANVGNIGIRDAYLRYGDSDGDFGYRFTLGYKRDDGFPQRFDSHQIRLATLRGDYQASERDSVELQLGFNSGEMEVDSIELSTTDIGRTRNHFAQLRWQHDLSSRENISLQAYYIAEGYAQVYDVAVPVLGRVVADNSLDSRRIDLEAQHTRQLSPTARLVWGGGLRRDSASAPAYFGARGSVDNDLYRLFGNLEWRLGQRLLLNAGAMWERTDIAGSDFAPRLALNYHINPSHSLRLSASRASRTPTLSEAGSDFRVPVYDSQLPWLPSRPMDFVSTLWKGRPDLASETITAYELGYVASLPQRGLSLDLKLYRNKLDGLIYMDESKVTDPTDYYDGWYFVPGNYGQAIVRGVETAINYQPWRESRLVFSYSYTDLSSTLPHLLPDKGNSTAPRNILSLLLMQAFPAGVDGSLAYYYVSESDGLGSGDPIPEVSRLDLRLAWGFRGRGLQGEIAAVVQNALPDSAYLDWRDDNLYQRRQYVSLDLRFD